MPKTGFVNSVIIGKKVFVVSSDGSEYTVMFALDTKDQRGNPLTPEQAIRNCLFEIAMNLLNETPGFSKRI